MCRIAFRVNEFRKAQIAFLEKGKMYQISRVRLRCGEAKFDMETVGCESRNNFIALLVLLLINPVQIAFGTRIRQTADFRFLSFLVSLQSPRGVNDLTSIES